MTAFRWCLFSCLLLASCRSEQPATQVVVSINGDLTVGSELTRVEVAVFEVGGVSPVEQRGFQLTAHEPREGEQRLPFSLGVRKGRDARFVLVVSGYGPIDGVERKVIEQKAIASFQDRQTLLLKMFLGNVCYGLDRVCEDLQTTCYLSAQEGVESGRCGPVPELRALSAVRPGDEANAWSADGGVALDAATDGEIGAQADGGGPADAGSADGGELNDAGDALAPALLSVVASTPGEGGVLEDPASPISVRFSSAVSASTVSPSTVRLLRAGQPVAGTLTPLGDTVSFAAATPLTLGASYTLELSSALAGGAGEQLAATQISFRVRAGSWAAASSLSPLSFDFDLAVAPGGNAALTWSYDAVARPHLWISRFDGSAWSAPEQLSTDNSQAVNQRSQVAVNDAGQVAVVWEYFDGIRATAYDGTMWRPRPLLGTGYGPHVALDAQGNAYAVVRGGDTGGQTGVFGVRFGVSATGSSSLLLFADTIAFAPLQRVVTWGAGALAVWESSSRPNSVRARSFESGDSAAVISGATISASELAFAADARGQSALAIWRQVDGGVANIWAARIVQGQAFAAPVQLSDGLSDAAHASVAVDARGAALAVWEQAGAVGSNVLAASFDPASGIWSAPQLLSDGSNDSARNPTAAAEPGGGAIVLWQQNRFDGSSIDAVATYGAIGQGFAPESRRVVSPVPASVGAVQLGIDDRGRAIAAFSHTNAVWAARFE